MFSPSPEANCRIRAQRVEGRTLIGALFERLDPKTGAPDLVALAQEAELHVDLAKKQVVIRMRVCNVSSSDGATSAFFKEKDWPVQLPSTLVGLPGR